MMKEQQKLYQNLTAKEIIENLKAFINYYKTEEQKIPLCMVAGIEYIYLHEKKEKENAKEKENNINES